MQVYLLVYLRNPLERTMDCSNEQINIAFAPFFITYSHVQ